jgi:hypothetical protein
MISTTPTKPKFGFAKYCKYPDGNLIDFILPTTPILQAVSTDIVNFASTIFAAKYVRSFSPVIDFHIFSATATTL